MKYYIKPNKLSIAGVNIPTSAATAVNALPIVINGVNATTIILNGEEIVQKVDGPAPVVQTFSTIEDMAAFINECIARTTDNQLTSLVLKRTDNSIVYSFEHSVYAASHHTDWDSEGVTETLYLDIDTLVEDFETSELYRTIVNLPEVAFGDLTIVECYGNGL